MPTGVLKHFLMFKGRKDHVQMKVFDGYRMVVARHDIVFKVLSFEPRQLSSLKFFETLFVQNYKQIQGL